MHLEFCMKCILKIGGIENSLLISFLYEFLKPSWITPFIEIKAFFFQWAKWSSELKYKGTHLLNLSYQHLYDLQIKNIFYNGNDRWVSRGYLCVRIAPIWGGNTELSNSQYCFLCECYQKSKGLLFQNSCIFSIAWIL